MVVTMAANRKQWHKMQVRDPYVSRARAENYRCRAVYKLKEIDERYRLFASGQIVCDLGAAPGSWSQYAAERCRPRGYIVAVDVLTMAELDNVRFICGDFTKDQVMQACYTALQHRLADLVISDMSPNITGIRDTDQARSLYLAESVLAFARKTLKQNGKMLVKLFQGAGIDAYRKELSRHFQGLVNYKPKASRSASREVYVLASGYKV